MQPASNILVLGVGNNLLADEGVGQHAVMRLRSLDMEPALSLVDAGTLGPAMLDHVMHADAIIIIDAAMLGQAPGSITCRQGNELDALLQGGVRTVHELGVRDLLDMARLSGGLPQRRALIAVEPARIAWGTELSPAVARSLDGVVAIVRDLASQWTHSEDTAA